MMQYEVGPDALGEPYELNVEKYVWLIAWYEDYGYEGGGMAAALRKDGIVEYKNLGHCSCYGPTDSWDADSTKVELAEFLKFDEFDDIIPEKRRAPNDCDFKTWQAIVVKAKEITAN